MTINCGICGNEIPSHMVEVEHGSHYSEHYESEEHILHKDLGRILKINITNEMNKKLDEIQKEKEPEIVKKAFYKILVSTGFVVDISTLRTIEDIKSLISNLHAVIKEAENNKIVIESGEPEDRYIFKSTKFGRHNNSHWTRLHIPNIDVCAKCFKWFEKESISLGSLDVVIPNLKLKEINKDIWEDIKNCEVGIELEDW